MGFDEPCLGVYYPSKKWYQYTKTKGIKNSDNLDKSFVCTSPTFSQSFRWFREKHGLYGIPEERTLNNFSYQVKSNKEGAITFIVYGGYPLNFNTYEEAELACLIKLIEIVKQKQ